MSSIPLPALNIRPPQQTEGPLDAYSKALALRGMQQNQQLHQQQMEMGNVQLQMQQQQLRDNQTVMQTLSQHQGDVTKALPDLAGKVSPQTFMGLQKFDFEKRKAYAEVGEKELKIQQDRASRLAAVIQQAQAMPPEQYQQMAPQIAQAVQELRPDIQLQPGQFIPQEKLGALGIGVLTEKHYADWAENQRKQREADAKLPGQIADSKMKSEDASLPPMERHMRGQAALEYYAAKGDPLAQQALQKKVEVAKASRPITNIMTPDDSKAIADAIERGEQPPTLQGLYRNAGPVRAELARRGVPLAKMETDWRATQRYMSSLNGPQQLRLQQSVQSASDLLDKIEGLYGEWKQLAPVNGYKILNRAALTASKNVPGRMGAVANALDTQIAELTADLGNIYMGGNSPTDQALKLGAKALSSDWNDESFTEGLKQARLNVRIRKNSMTHGSPAGLSGTTNYAPQGAAQPSTNQSGPKVGDVEGGYRFKGGDPKSQSSWEKI